MDFPLWSVGPFVLMLLAIAIVPAIVPQWWSRNSNKLLVSIGFSIPVLIVIVPQAPLLLLNSLKDYFSFMVLLGALFVISGGILIKGEMAGTPLVNTVFLAAGAILSNVFGTTGASMLLIRPFLRANQARQHQSHLVVFFIFIVSNVGGLLTPLGDPPLFLGFLRGIPFQWTLSLFPVWAAAVGALLVTFNFFDQYMFLKDDLAVHGALAERVQPRKRIQIEGGWNFLFLAGVMVTAILSGVLEWPRGIQEGTMILMAALSWFTTSKAIHRANRFHFAPLGEVAALFLGVFITMVPTLEILNTHAAELNLRTPWHYFWMSGGLSAFLDSAPAYLTFAAMASGLVGGTPENLNVLLNSDLGWMLLRAVSCGTVFMGAISYIGNGPNFMVKSIAEHDRVKMPSFTGYLAYSGIFLVPLFIILTLIFFR
jgi:Na+/H+ antiporter NhaD/arsenite permease-like protein